MNRKDVINILMAVLLPPLAVLIVYWLMMGAVFMFMQAKTFMDLMLVSTAFAAWIWVAYSIYQIVKHKRGGR